MFVVVRIIVAGLVLRAGPGAVGMLRKSA